MEYEPRPLPHEKVKRQLAVVAMGLDTLVCGKCNKFQVPKPVEAQCIHQECQQKWEYIAISEGKQNPLSHLNLPVVSSEVLWAENYTPPNKPLSPDYINVPPGEYF